MLLNHVSAFVRDDSQHTLLKPPDVRFLEKTINCQPWAALAQFILQLFVFSLEKLCQAKLVCRYFYEMDSIRQ